MTDDASEPTPDDGPSSDEQRADDVLSAEVVPAAGDGAPAGGSPDPLAALTGGLDLGSMMQMAEEMTAQMGEARAALAEERVVGTAGGGLVTVTLNGHLHLVELSIDPAAFDGDDPTVVEDLVLAAWRDAHDEVAELQSRADPMAGLGGLGDLGDLGGLLGGG